MSIHPATINLTNKTTPVNQTAQQKQTTLLLQLSGGSLILCISC